jgi:hypothetical protein
MTMNTATKNPISSEEISRVVSVARETVRLDLLADIDTTIDTLTRSARIFTKICIDFSELADYVSSSPVRSGVYIDPADENISLYEEAENVLKLYLPRMISKRAAIDRDPQLTPEHRESLHDAYDEATEAAALLHEAILMARNAIIGHDLDAEPREKLPIFDTVEALIADLHK